MSESTKGTHVDLGDDLLQTRTVSKPVARAEARAETDSIEELLLNSKILIREGLLEDAKKTLRRVLREDPANLSARERLDEVQRIEIKRLLGPDEAPARGGGFLKAKPKRGEAIAEDGDIVCAALERELGPAPTPETRFFADDADRADFSANLEALCAGASPTDRIDLGIGFLEMELYGAAVQMFRAAADAEPGERRARALLATAWIAQGNGFEAMLEIENLIADQSAPPAERVDYGYLAGRAQELLGNFEMAARWYRAVLQTEAHYRDADDRLRRSLKMLNPNA